MDGTLTLKRRKTNGKEGKMKIKSKLNTKPSFTDEKINIERERKMCYILYLRQQLQL